jgi:thioester reductase-like protein
MTMIDVERELREIAGRILKIDAGEIQAEEALSEFGFDSITLTELAGQINERFDTELTPAVLFELTSIRRLAEHLQGQAAAAGRAGAGAGAGAERERPLREAAEAPSSQAGRAEDGRPAPAPRSSDGTGGAPALIAELKGMVSGILKVEVAELDAEEQLGAYGFDSITLTELAAMVNERYRVGVTPAHLFEHSSLAAFAAFLLKESPAAFERGGGERVKGAGPAQDLHVEACLPPGRGAAGNGVAGEVREDAIADAPAFRQGRREDIARDRETAAGDPIAIIGMAGVMPESEDLRAFWSHLLDRHDLVREIPGSRWDWRAAFGDPGESGKTNAKWGAFVPDVDKFDAEFFSLSPLEAEGIDPQHRMFLEATWKAIEDAGYRPESLAGSRTGVFVGVATFDYALLHARERVEIEPYYALGLVHSVLANRVSYLLGLLGPSEPIDTACSSSLVAVHRAIAAIGAGECEMAIAGGVNAILSPTLHVAFSKAGMLSPDGRCKTFDEGADGYVRGEGVGAILLKPLSKALADGDHVHAVVLGSAVNHGGRAQSITAPNPQQQADVIVRAVRKARVHPATITYVEAHGTGTALGDPVEVNGLKKAFAELFAGEGVQDPPAGFCGLGSVKTNVGHLETAAGMAGLFKVVLAMRHKKIPAMLHLHRLNRYIDVSASPFYFVTESREWARPRVGGREYPRRAGVSSFGFGGVNAHIVLEEWESDPARPSSETGLFVLSARSGERLKAYAGAFTAFLDGLAGTSQGPSLAEIAYTAQVGRSELDERLAIVAGDVGELASLLHDFCDGVERPGAIFTGRRTRDGGRDGARGEEERARVASALQRGELVELARLWTSGAAVDWSKLHPPGKKARRVPLPTYPFARQRHWLPRAGATRVPPESPPASSLRLPVDPEAAAPEAGAVRQPGSSEDRAESCGRYLRHVLATAIKVPTESVSPLKPFEEYGIDSLAVTKLTREMEKRLGELPKTLFFEHRNAKELAEYLVRRYPHVEWQRAGEGRSLAVEPPGPSGAVQPRGGDPAGPRPAPSNGGRTEASATVLAPTRDQDVAVVGLAGTYPESASVDELWANLAQGKDCIREIPKERWDHERYFDESKDAKGKSYGKWGGFVPDADRFDASFFRISPAEAKLLDPQERLFLENAWRCLEDAGLPRRALEGRRVGVFAGVMWGQYQLLLSEDRGALTAPSSSYASIANRVSYFFDLHGPSMAVDTMCSSSLTAIHLACESIRRGECDVALAGGVSVATHPAKYVQLSALRFLSSDGRCRSFGEGGDGYVPGEGVGTIVLRPLGDAVENRDRIYAVIRATSVNHGGRSNGYTVPNPNAQAALIREALGKARVEPESISYVEAHGTGTALGDPIEIVALCKAFEGGGPRPRRCAIGSIKSNIGHAEAAAGIAGVTKVLLQLQHRTLVPSIHSSVLNRNIDFEATPFRVQRELAGWEHADGLPRRACVSAFGAGGANSHVVLEEWLEERAAPAGEPEGEQLVVLSASSREALLEHAKDVAELLGSGGSGRPGAPGEGDGLRGPVPSPSAALAVIVDALADALHVRRDAIAPDDDLLECGCDARTFAKVSAAVGERYAIELTEAEYVDHPSIEALARRVHELAESRAAGRREGATPAARLRLEDVAYTSQLGREALEHRLAVVCLRLDDLEGALERFAREGASASDGERVFLGEGPRADGDLRGFMETHGSELVDRVVASGDLSAIARLWVGGVSVPWEKLHRSSEARKIALPARPLRRSRFWIDRPAEAPEAGAPPAPAAVHAAAAPSGRPPLDERAAEVERCVTEGFAEELGLPPQGLEPDRDLAEYGASSITFVRVINKLRGRFGAQALKADALQARDIRRLAAHVSAALQRDGAPLDGDRGRQAESVTRRERRAGSEASALPEKLQLSPRVAVGKVFLTGATGVLGASLLKQLLQDTDAEVICLVRPHGSEDGKRRLRDFLRAYDPGLALASELERRVVAVPGDVERPWLGLDASRFRDLARSTDLVIHNAAKTSLHGVYEDLKGVNVDGAQHMIEFALESRHRYFALVSSYTVLGDRLYERGFPFAEDDLDVGQRFEGLGYARSKCEAEKLVRAAHADGLKWIVVRPGNVLGESRTGRYPFGMTGVPGIYYDLLRTFIALGVAPDSSQWFDVTPVDYVSRAMAHLCVARQEVYSTYHLLNPDRRPLRDLVLLLDELGYPIELIDPREFSERILRPDLGFQSMSLDLMRFNPIYMLDKESATISSEATARLLRGEGIVCPKLDTSLLGAYVDLCVAQGILPPRRSPRVRDGRHVPITRPAAGARANGDHDRESEGPATPAGAGRISVAGALTRLKRAVGTSWQVGTSVLGSLGRPR